MLLGTFEALRRALRLNARVYHFHDPELIPVGLLLKLFRKKVIYDVHENTTEIILSKEYLGFWITRKLVSTAVTCLEKACKLFFDRIIVVSPDIASHWSSPKVHIILNAAILKTIDHAKKIDLAKTKPAVIYAGNLSSKRGLLQIIEAIGLLEGKAELWLLGMWENETLKKDCERLEGWKHVKYFGYLPVEEVYGYMKNSDISIVTFLPLPNHITAFPNKPLEYMACRLPVIMSDFAFWKKTYADNVLFVNPESPLEIKNAIAQLVNDKNLRMNLSEKGRKFIEDNYSWESESTKLIKIYKSLDSAV
jgi:glycosyltransferase involved in cell wall biosynthesis